MVVKIIPYMLLLFLFCVLAACGGSDQASGFEEDVSIINLIASPEKFHGKTIKISGYAKISKETSALYLSEDDAKYTNFPNSIWLDIEKSKKELFETINFNNQWVFIEGEFDASHKGHLGMYRGAIVSMQRLELLQE